MSVRTGQTVVAEFTTADPTTGAAANATGTPAGTLVINGTDDAAAVTVTNKETGVYKASVTLPTLTPGDTVMIRVSATVDGVAGKGVVWRDACDVLLSVGGAVTLTTGERDSIAAALLDLAAGVETSVTVRQALRGMAAALLGQLSGAATTTATIKAAANSGTTRITATVDADGNRSALTLNL